MRFKLIREHGALNSHDIFNAFEQGARHLGHEIVNDDHEAVVIWSVLWHGRMKHNEAIYRDSIKQGKPVIIIEVGNLLRNKTWRICLNNINGLGTFGNGVNLDPDRPNKLGVTLQPENLNRNESILIATQHEKSLQWENMPSMKDWTTQTIHEIRKYTDRSICIRPHPRSPMTGIENNFKNVFRQYPKHIANTYDDYDIGYGYHCVVNYNSGPPILAAIAGTPVITGSSSLAHPVSDVIQNIDNPKLKDRSDWLMRISHCEWTVDEIRQGIPLQRLEQHLNH